MRKDLLNLIFLSSVVYLYSSGLFISELLLTEFEHIFFVCMCLCAFKIYSQQNLTVILRMCLGNKKYELKLSPCISVGGHSDGGGDAKCGEERRAEEVLVGRAGPSERGDD